MFTRACLRPCVTFHNILIFYGELLSAPYNISTFHLFIDFKAAYDSIRRDKLLMAMEEFEIPRKLINLTKITLMKVRCRVKIQK
jgi:hypothetical protein